MTADHPTSIIDHSTSGVDHAQCLADDGQIPSTGTGDRHRGPPAGCSPAHSPTRHDHWRSHGQPLLRQNEDQGTRRRRGTAQSPAPAGRSAACRCFRGAPGGTPRRRRARRSRLQPPPRGSATATRRRPPAPPAWPATTSDRRALAARCAAGPLGAPTRSVTTRESNTRMTCRRQLPPLPLALARFLTAFR